MSYRRRYLRPSGGKYSNETVTFAYEASTNLDAGDTWPNIAEPQPGQIPKGVLIVPATNVMGNRKVKNFTIKVTTKNSNSPIYGALVYVPEGTTPGDLGTNSRYKSLYEPNQNVICSFIIPPNCNRIEEDGNYFVYDSQSSQLINVTSRLARNLSSGDMIVLLFSNSMALYSGPGTHTDDNGRVDAKTEIYGSVNYAIRY